MPGLLFPLLYILMDSNDQNGDMVADIKEEPETAPPLDSVVQAMHGARVTEEDAALLELGPEFRVEQDAQPIFLAEVSHLLRLQVDAKTEKGFTEINPVLKKSLEYAEKFGHIIKTEDAIQIRAQLMGVPGIHPFEVAQIASLFPKDAEEAKAIIPSLKDRYEDDELNEMIEQLDVWLPTMA